MKNAVKLLTFLVLSFLLIYSASAALSSPFDIIVELLAFALPVAVGYSASRKYKREREEVAGVAEREPTLVGLDGGSAVRLLPLIAPTVAVVFLVSFLTSLLLGALGLSGSTVEDAPLWQMLLLHALMPAVLEEALFRYLPMKLIAPYSKRWCVILSSAYFALIHMNLYQLPYAFLAGFIFILLDIAAESVWPSVILHLINNAVSVLWIKYSSGSEFVLWFLIIMITLALAGAAVVIFRRKQYLSMAKTALSEGEPLTDLYAPMLFVTFTLLMTVFNLF